MSEVLREIQIFTSRSIIVLQADALPLNVVGYTRKMSKNKRQRKIRREGRDKQGIIYRLPMCYQWGSQEKPRMGENGFICSELKKKIKSWQPQCYTQVWWLSEIKGKWSLSKISKNWRTSSQLAQPPVNP